MRTVLSRLPETMRLAVAVEGHAPHGAFVAAALLQFLAAGRVPDADRAVAAAGDDLLPVEAEGHARDRIVVPFDRPHGLAGLRVPKLDQAVVAAGDDPLAVAAPGHAGGLGRMVLERQHDAVGLEIPNGHGAVFAGQGQTLAVGAIGQTEHLPRRPPRLLLLVLVPRDESGREASPGRKRRDEPRRAERARRC